MGTGSSAVTGADQGSCVRNAFRAELGGAGPRDTGRRIDGGTPPPHPGMCAWGGGRERTQVTGLCPSKSGLGPWWRPAARHLPLQSLKGIRRGGGEYWTQVSGRRGWGVAKERREWGYGYCRCIYEG